jgi:hypothetical protein
MHTSARPSIPGAATAPIYLAYDGQIVEPVSLEHDTRSGAHSLRIVMQPAGMPSKCIIAHVAVDPGESATVAAQALADRLNKAVKQGRDAIQLQARAEHAILVLRGAAILSHEEPERQEITPPKVVEVADLFAAAAS